MFEGEQSGYVERLQAFKAGLREFGYIEGRDYSVEQRSANTDFSRLPALVAELLALKVDLIVPAGTPSAIAAREATREVPIVIVTVGDPVGSGLASSLRQPGGNVTGLTNLNSDLYAKRLDLMRQLLPRMRRAGFLCNPDNGNDMLSLNQFKADCLRYKFEALPAFARRTQDLATAFDALKRANVQGLIVTETSTNNAWGELIVEQAAKHRIPAVYGLTRYVDLGGLVSYGTNYPDLYRRAAAYVQKIFAGTNPKDLPIEQPTKFEMAINMDTAKLLGIRVSESILVQSTKVIGKQN